jgi:hypothetical protein
MFRKSQDVPFWISYSHIPVDCSTQGDLMSPGVHQRTYVESSRYRSKDSRTRGNAVIASYSLLALRVREQLQAKVSANEHILRPFHLRHRLQHCQNCLRWAQSRSAILQFGHSAFLPRPLLELASSLLVQCYRTVGVKEKRSGIDLSVDWRRKECKARDKNPWPQLP